MTSTFVYLVVVLLGHFVPRDRGTQSVSLAGRKSGSPRVPMASPRETRPLARHLTTHQTPQNGTPAVRQSGSSPAARRA